MQQRKTWHRNWTAVAGKRLAFGMLAIGALTAAPLCAAASLDGGASSASERFSQRLVVSGGRGDGVCSQGSRWSTEDYVCHPAEIAPTAEQRTMVVTASGHAIGSLVVTYDGFGSGKPVLAVKKGQCPADFRLEDGSAQLIGAKAEFIITPAQGGSPRTIDTVIASQQSAQFLREGRGRVVFALPSLERALSTPEPVDLGMVNPGDHIKLRLFAVGTTTTCDNGTVEHKAVQARLWGQSSTEAIGYLGTPQRSDTWDDTKIAPFKVVATISY
jgi:hypothetical protein